MLNISDKSDKNLINQIFGCIILKSFLSHLCRSATGLTVSAVMIRDAIATSLAVSKVCIIYVVL